MKKRLSVFILTFVVVITGIFSVFDFTTCACIDPPDGLNVLLVKNRAEDFVIQYYQKHQQYPSFEELKDHLKTQNHTELKVYQFYEQQLFKKEGIYYQRSKNSYLLKGIAYVRREAFGHKLKIFKRSVDVDNDENISLDFFN